MAWFEIRGQEIWSDGEYFARTKEDLIKILNK